MIPLERRQFILQQIALRGVVGIYDLAHALSVSHMTIRRDLDKLQQEGLVVLVSGGVKISKKLSAEPELIVKESMAAEEKMRIAKAAVEYIPRNGCIFLDDGTTTLALAQLVSDWEDLTVVTNDFVIMDFLSEHSVCTVFHTGGMVRKRYRYCVGEMATKIIKAMTFDVSFMSASSWDERGVTTPDIEKLSVKQAAINSGRKNILICDQSKYGQVATFLAFDLKDLDLIISDTKLSKQAIEAVAERRVELKLV
jgi:DeoR/GlpR family transcriptional regulator of sugar metabolism